MGDPSCSSALEQKVNCINSVQHDMKNKQGTKLRILAPLVIRTGTAYVCFFLLSFLGFILHLVPGTCIIGIPSCLNCFQLIRANQPIDLLIQDRALSFLRHSFLSAIQSCRRERMCRLRLPAKWERLWQLDSVGSPSFAAKLLLLESGAM